LQGEKEERDVKKKRWSSETLPDVLTTGTLSLSFKTGITSDSGMSDGTAAVPLTKNVDEKKTFSKEKLEEKLFFILLLPSFFC